MSKQVEILAPGASLSALKTAIDAGADAVYFGGSKFSARSNAVNLSNEEIEEATSYAHLRNVKLYVAVNTIVDDTELSDAFEFIKFCYETGIDGVIVQDLGIARIVKQYFPKMRLHASTQMTIHNLSGVIEAEKLGFDRVVLSRELSFDDIKYISENSDVELEVFVHGALCMSYSGQCLFSSFLGGRSGNRGACAQPCRLSYTLTDASGNDISEKNKYLLSLRDLCLVDYLKKLENVGVTSLKIEGRMKSEAYVSAVCGVYNKYRDGKNVDVNDKNLLENIFSRNGFTQGFFFNKCGRNMLSYGSNHDDIFDSATKEVLDKAKSFSEGNEYKINVLASFTMKNNEPAIFTISYKGDTFSVKSSCHASIAQNMPFTKERIFEQLSKLGGTVFSYEKIDIDIQEGLYIPVKELNRMRRDVFAMLEERIAGKKRVYENGPMMVVKPQNPKLNEHIYTCSVLNGNQAMKAYDLGFEKIYISPEVYFNNKEFYDSEPDIFVIRTYPIRHDSMGLPEFDFSLNNICVSNIGDIEKYRHMNIHADYRLNVFNSMSVKTLMSMGVKSFTLSPELTITQMKNIAKSISAEIVVYGRIALMTLKNCVVKSSLGKCGCEKGRIYYLKDRKNISFPLITDKNTCTNIIYNSAPIVMSDRMNELEKTGALMYRFDFTDESVQEMERIVRNYESASKPQGFFTRGHFYNGII